MKLFFVIQIILLTFSIFKMFTAPKQFASGGEFSNGERWLNVTWALSFLTASTLAYIMGWI
jgi:hypothetical protein